MLKMKPLPSFLSVEANEEGKAGEHVTQNVQTKYFYTIHAHIMKECIIIKHHLVFNMK